MVFFFRSCGLRHAGKSIYRRTSEIVDILKVIITDRRKVTQGIPSNISSAFSLFTKIKSAEVEESPAFCRHECRVRNIIYEFIFDGKQ